MRVGLLCPGPSLSRFIRPQVPFDLTVAVNRAAAAHPCTWWAAGDWQTIESVAPVGRPHLLTMDPSHEYLLANRPDLLAGRMVRRFWSLRALQPPEGYCTWSTTAALVFACFLGATRIECHGVDMAGERDFAGVPSVSGDRWDREKKDFAAVAQWLSSRGVELVRCPT